MPEYSNFIENIYYVNQKEENQESDWIKPASGEFAPSLVSLVFLVFVSFYFLIFLWALDNFFID